MNNYTFNIFGKQCRRVQKRTALKHYMKGGTVYACPVLLRPGAPWHPEQCINLNQAPDDMFFDDVGRVNWFNDWIYSVEYYNLRPGTGQYLAFYIDGGDAKCV